MTYRHRITVWLLALLLLGMSIYLPVGHGESVRHSPVFEIVSVHTTEKDATLTLEVRTPGAEIISAPVLIEENAHGSAIHFDANQAVVRFNVSTIDLTDTIYFPEVSVPVEADDSVVLADRVIEDPYGQILTLVGTSVDEESNEVVLRFGAEPGARTSVTRAVLTDEHRTVVSLGSRTVYRGPDRNVQYSALFFPLEARAVIKSSGAELRVLQYRTLTEAYARWAE